MPDEKTKPDFSKLSFAGAVSEETVTVNPEPAATSGVPRTTVPAFPGRAVEDLGITPDSETDLDSETKHSENDAVVNEVNESVNAATDTSEPTPEISEAEVQEELVEEDDSVPSELQEVVEEENSANTEDELDEHDDNLYGNAWEIIKYSGVATTFIWGAVSGVVAGAAGFFFAPQPSWVLLAVLGFFLGVVANVDRKTHLIKNAHTLTMLAVSIPLAAFVASQLSWWNLLGGLVSGVAIMGVFLLLIIFVGFGSGGDLKSAPVVAFALGVINPLIPAIWFFLALVITTVLIVVRNSKKTELKDRNTSFGEGMAASIPLAVIATYFAFNAAHIAYM